MNLNLAAQTLSPCRPGKFSNVKILSHSMPCGGGAAPPCGGGERSSTAPFPWEAATVPACATASSFPAGNASPHGASVPAYGATVSPCAAIVPRDSLAASLPGAAVPRCSGDASRLIWAVPFCRIRERASRGGRKWDRQPSISFGGQCRHPGRRSVQDGGTAFKPERSQADILLCPRHTRFT